MTDQRDGRLRTLIASLVYRMQALTLFGYMGVASIIGVEALVVVLGFTTVLPIAIPFLLIVFAFGYFFRERVRALWAGVLAKLSRSASS